MRMFVRAYSRDGREYTCGVFCDVRGPGIEDRADFDLGEIDCPSCLAILAKKGA